MDRAIANNMEIGAKKGTLKIEKFPAKGIRPAFILVTLNEHVGDVVDFAHSKDLSYNDLSLCYESAQDGWSYLYDANRDLVAPLTDYDYDLLQDILEGEPFETIKIPFYPNDELYEDYEWNEGRKQDEEEQ